MGLLFTLREENVTYFDENTIKKIFWATSYSLGSHQIFVGILIN
jgi:hypothetical protein